MKINIKNEEKIRLTLASAQINANVRTVTYQSVIDLVEAAEKWLTSKGLPKSAWVKSRFSYAEHVNCNSYYAISYAANSTEISVERGTSGWFLIDARRVSLPTGHSGSSDYSVFLSEVACNKAIQKFKLSLHKM